MESNRTFAKHVVAYLEMLSDVGSIPPLPPFQVSQPGNSIPFLFSGRVSGDIISGSIFLGEYLTDQFTAKRSTYQKLRKPFAIPGEPSFFLRWNPYLSVSHI